MSIPAKRARDPRFAAIGTAIAALTVVALLSLAPRPGVAQANSPFVGKWSWASEWGPIALNITSILPGGKPRGTFTVTASSSIRRFQLADKVSGVEMAAKITGDRFVGRLYSGSVVDLRLVGGKLVGTYVRGDYLKANAVFTK